ncbi:hypothetical protein P9847_22120 [Paenibacillus chibensis]|uniref:Uncharacterized protein n=1 Tax=Paenibacillus chibensis TaxID=59846 RepID=A0ABU6PYK5_9BACL|nr:hypothetical protein [Paenibacillus chibensis]
MKGVGINAAAHLLCQVGDLLQLLNDMLKALYSRLYRLCGLLTLGVK